MRRDEESPLLKFDFIYPKFCCRVDFAWKPAKCLLQ